MKQTAAAALLVAATALTTPATVDAATITTQLDVFSNSATTGIFADPSFAVGQTVDWTLDTVNNTFSFTSNTGVQYNSTFSLAPVPVLSSLLNTPVFSFLAADATNGVGATLSDGDLDGQTTVTENQFFAALTTGNNTGISGSVFDTGNGGFLGLNGGANKNFTLDTSAAVVPLPASAFLLLSAAGGLAALRRRKGARQAKVA